MNNHQRGIYQPLVDNIPVYDLSDDDSDNEERSRLPLMIVVGLVIMAAFTGVVWLAYNQGVERGRSGTIVISAPEGPVRTKPADAGGEGGLTGLKVYGKPESPEAAAKSSQLAVNTAPAVPAPPPPSIRLNPSTPAATPAPQAKPEASKQVASTVTPATQVKPEAPKPAAPAQTASAAPPKVQAVPAPAASPPPAQTASVAAPVPVAAAVPAQATAAGTGWVMQLGSYESADLANSSWTGFKSKYADVLGELSTDVQRADLGARGIFFRLRAGHYADKGEAAATCQKLKASGGNCLVTAQ